MKKLYAIHLLIFLMNVNLLAKNSGETGANFIKIPVAPIPTGLSEAYTAMIGPDSILYNSGSLGLISYNTISFAHNSYLLSMNQEYLSSNLYTDYFNIGCFFSTISSGKIKAYDENDIDIGNTSSQHRYYGFSLSKSWPHFENDKGKMDTMLISNSWTKIPMVKEYRPKVYRFSLGFAMKFIDESLDTVKSKTSTYDLGAMLVLPNHWQLGLSMQNISGSQNFGYSDAKIPQTIRFGFAKDFHSDKELMVFIFSADMVKYSDYSSFVNLGTNVDILKMFQLRFGYRTKKDEGSKISAGLGMNFDKLSSKESFFKGMRLDYGFYDYGVLGITHKIGIQLIW